MALFAYAALHQDDVVPACYAALDMKPLYGEYAEKVRHMHGVELQIRVGESSGEVVVRAIRSDLLMDYTAVGQTAHLAWRGWKQPPRGADPPTVDTLRLAGRIFRGESPWPSASEGAGRAHRWSSLIGVISGRSGSTPPPRGLTEFLGRRMSLRPTKVARAELAGGQVIAIVGEAGVGKSRLIWEVTHSHRVQGCRPPSRLASMARRRATCQWLISSRDTSASGRS